MNWGHLIGGTVELLLTSADCSASLLTLEKAGIAVYEVTYIDPFQIRFTIKKYDQKRLFAWAKKRGENVTVLQQKGLFFTAFHLRKRPILVLGTLLLIFLSLWLPSRVLFIQVEGNKIVPSNQILEKAQECGIKFGATRREVRSEKMKNALLEAMPQLQWAGINTYGCTATITVKERSDFPNAKSDAGVSSIIALRDCVIREITVLRGTPLCSVGDAVKAHQILVSGYTDHGICIVGTQAKAEIYGETVRTISLVYPINYTSKRNVRPTKKKFSLIIGKKRINFSKESGIYGTTCDKIYEEKYMTLPGGFQLPFGIGIETHSIYETASQIIDPSAHITNLAESFLMQQLITGKIITSNYLITQAPQHYRLDGIYNCLELIGITRTEENITTYEQNH